MQIGDGMSRGPRQSHTQTALRFIFNQNPRGVVGRHRCANRQTNLIARFNRSEMFTHQSNKFDAVEPSLEFGIHRRIRHESPPST